MSYEGFYEFLCKNGHYERFDVYDSLCPEYGGRGWKCLECGEPCHKFNSVDQTNGFDPSTSIQPLANKESAPTKDGARGDE